MKNGKNGSLNKSFNAIMLAWRLLALSSQYAEAQSTTFSRNPEKTTTATVDQTHANTPTIPQISKTINTTWGDPDETLTNAIWEAIEDLNGKGNSTVENEFTTAHVKAISSTFKNFISKNFPNYSNKMPKFTVSVNDDIVNIITITFNNTEVSIKILWTRTKPVISVSCPWKKTVTEKFDFGSTEELVATDNRPIQYGTEVSSTLISTNTKHTVAAWEYLGRDILPSLWFTNPAFIANAAIAIDSVYGKWNMQIWTLIELSEDSNKSSDDGKNGTWKFVVSGKNAAWIMVNKTVTIIRTTKVETVKGKKQNTPVFSYTIIENSWNNPSMIPTTYSTVDWGWTAILLIWNHTPSFIFTDKTRAGFTQVLRDELSVDPTLASRAWGAIQSKLNELNGWVELKIKAWSTIKYDPNTKTIVYTMDGVTVTVNYGDNNSINSTTHTGELSTNNNANLAPATYSTTTWVTNNTVATVDNPIIVIGEDWFANITKKWIGRSLEVCILWESAWSPINAETLGSRVWVEINNRLNTNVFNIWWTLQAHNSKIKVEFGSYNEIEVTIVYPKPNKWKKWIYYGKTLTTSIFNITFGPNSEIMVFNKSN